jgi:hypothetical protein
MASFVSSNLSHEITGSFVVFKLDAKLRFEAKEIGHRWLFQIEFKEQDPLKDDAPSGTISFPPRKRSTSLSRRNSPPT